MIVCKYTSAMMMIIGRIFLQIQVFPEICVTVEFLNV